MNEATLSLARVLIDCFKDDVDTDNEKLLHEDSYVSKKLKRHLGREEFKEYDKYGEEVWSNAWNEFSRVAFHTRGSK
ncbi:hypothetical protein [Paenibacillus illinoisensis]|uniref:hypothetical protein n=1 Tax=Paenibacillus illinoisensis TaxID=59845 RepID=UPI000DA1A94D|nr:hypothetical protein [Paenibacillus illinoisensis]